MVIYNHREFLDISRVIEQLVLISSALEERGTHRYQLQKHLTILLSAQDYTFRQLK